MKPLPLLIIFLLIRIFLFAQDPQTYLAKSNPGLCSYSLSLYKDGSFSMENECESLSHVTIGSWVIKQDTIKLKPIDNKNFKVIKNITNSNEAGDTISIMIYDNKGINITYKISIGLVTQNGTYFFEKDSSGTKKFVHKRKNGKIVFKTLNRIFEQRFDLDGDAANNFIVNLNIPGEWIYNQRADWSGIGAFDLVKKKNKLITTRHQFINPLIFEPVKE